MERVQKMARSKGTGHRHKHPGRRARIDAAAQKKKRDPHPFRKRGCAVHELRYVHDPSIPDRAQAERLWMNSSSVDNRFL